MSIPGYAEHKKREFCNDVACPIQPELNAHKEDSEEYEKIMRCKEECKFTAHDFYYWLIEKSYLIVIPENKK